MKLLAAFFVLAAISPVFVHERLAELPRVTVNTALSPVASFIYQCDPAPSRSCTFASTSSGVIVRHYWTWGNKNSESHFASIAKNTWAVDGTYIVTLTVTDAQGASSMVARTIVLPAVTQAVHDTIAVAFTFPTPLPSASHINVDSSLVGQPIRVFAFTLLGMLDRRADGSVMAFRDSASTTFTVQNGPLTVGVFRQAGSFKDLPSAVQAVQAPLPTGWQP